MRDRLDGREVEQGVFHRKIEQSAFPELIFRQFVFKRELLRGLDVRGRDERRRRLFGEDLEPFQITGAQRQGQNVRDTATAYVHVAFVSARLRLFLEMRLGSGVREILVAEQVLHVETAQIIDTVRNVRAKTGNIVGNCVEETTLVQPYAAGYLPFPEHEYGV